MVERAEFLDVWRRFETVVADIAVDRTLVTDGGQYVSGPSMYQEVRNNLAGEQGARKGGAAARSMPPLWVAGLDWLESVDKVARRLGYGQLIEVLDGRWAPEQVGELDQAEGELRSLHARGGLLLASRTSFEVDAPCPACEVRTLRRADDAGDEIAVKSLVVSLGGGMCRACGMSWAPEELYGLAEMVGEGFRLEG